MPTLYLLRHAKSSWSDESLRDFDRPLKGRGRKAAELIGRVLGTEKLDAPLVISSPALRARETTELVLNSSGLSSEPRFDERIYEADLPALLEVVSTIPEAAETAIMVGHNPGFEALLAFLTGENRQMPTCALARIKLSLGWNEVGEGAGRLRSFVTPKDLD
jgi:phosphohistidine phosphatase